jgi:RHS repeat-associated protein
MKELITADMFDTPNREYHPTQGRWITPAPSGLAAVDMTNPQTWNRYAYVNNNPLSYIDPTGLDLVSCDPEFGADCGGGGGGGPWICPAEFENCDPNCDPVFGCGGPPPTGPPTFGGPPPNNGGPNGGGTHGPWPGNETTGLPQLPTQPLSLGDLLGLTPGCDFGVCNPVGNGFAPAGALALPCIAQPEACAAILIGTYVIVVYGPQIIQTVKNITQTTADAVECAREWEQAREFCAELMSQGNPPAGVWGGSFDKCVRGQVSERCGGNRVDWGKGK